MDEDTKVELAAICKRFNAVTWHDSKLLSIHIVPSTVYEANQLYFEVKILTDAKTHELRNAILRLKDCTFIKIDLDLATKLICSDDISGAHCLKESSLKEKIQRDELRNEESPLADYLHFLIELVPPGGAINVFAKDFELIYRDEGNA